MFPPTSPGSRCRLWFTSTVADGKGEAKTRPKCWDHSWPEQIHDCKAALRWIARHADEYGIDRDRIALFGISAGGHLVSLLGTTVGDEDLEGMLGPKVDTPVRPRCVANFCGPGNFLTFESQGSIFSGEK